MDIQDELLDWNDHFTMFFMIIYVREMIHFVHTP